MKQCVRELLLHRDKTIPILSFPSTRLLGVTVGELISSPQTQAAGMEAVVKRCPVGAALNMMDLSVEAQAFGCDVRFTDDEVPTVTRGIIEDIADVPGIVIPQVGTARTGIYIEGVRLAKQRIRDVPVFCGVIGPYSLAGRLLDMAQLMMACYDEPELVHELLEKCTAFITAYLLAFKQAGADGVIMAEPAAGLLSPELCGEFSSGYVRAVREAADGEDFIFCYHNCAGGTVACAQSIAGTGADIYHFGNAVRLSEIIPLMPADSIVTGNVDPVMFKNGTPADIRACVTDIYNSCKQYPNFMLSSGCDIPACAAWENIDAYFEAVRGLVGQ